MGFEKPQLIHRQIASSADLTNSHWTLHSECRNVKSSKRLFKRSPIFHVFQELRDSHQPNPIQFLNDKRVEVISALLSIGHYVDPGVFLVLDRRQNSVISNRVEFFEAQLARVTLSESLNEPRRTGPASHNGHGKELSVAHATRNYSANN